MKRKIQKNENLIEKLIRNFVHHVGMGGDAHAPVNSFEAGFMTPEMYKSMRQYKELFRGDFETSKKGSIQLKDAISNYDEIEIIYNIGYNDNVTKISGAGLSKYVRTITAFNNFNGFTGVQLIEVDIQGDQKDPKKLNVVDFRGMTMYDKSVVNTSKDNSLRIYKITGIK